MTTATAKKEYRFLSTELRASGNKRGIRGLAARYNAKTMLQPGLSEIIRPGAFTKTVQRKDSCIACFNHDEQQILGRTSAGTLRLADTADGLEFDCDLPATSYAEDLLANIRAGNISECSFGFFLDDPEGDSFIQDGEGFLRELLSLRVFDVSPVVAPQYSGGVTNVTARSRQMWPEGTPTSVELRSVAPRVVAPVALEVTEEQIAQMNARLTLAKLSF
jgi:HK97 family phage prohead protease